jgi:hypothetical protein
MNYVSLKQLGKDLKLDKSNLKRYLLKEGIYTTFIRTADSKNQRTLAITEEDAEIYKERRQSQGFKYLNTPIISGKGFFYVVRIVPDLAPNRVKLGFATDVTSRMLSHRVAAPTAELIKKWACDRTWEQCAIASVSRIGCKHVGGEVFDCDSVEEIVKRANEFFNLMPEKIPTIPCC